MTELRERLKELRQRKGLSLQGLGAKCGLSKAFLCQIESGTANPSLATLKKIADALEAPLGSFFDHASTPPFASADLSSGSSGAGDVHVVRRSQRKKLVWPDAKGEAHLLSPDLQHKLQVTLAVSQPGYDTGVDRYAHPGEEFGFILEGEYEVTVGDQVFVLEEGDAIYFPSSLPHRMQVRGEKTAKTIWVVTPPSF